MGCGSGFSGAPTPQSVQPYKFSFTHDQFQGPVTANTLNAFLLKPKQVIWGMILKPTIQFAGPGFTSYKICLGEQVGTDFEQKYLMFFDVLQVVGTGIFGLGGPYMDMLDFVGGVFIKVSALCAGANLNASTAGAFDLYVYLSTLP